MKIVDKYKGISQLWYLKYNSVFHEVLDNNVIYVREERFDYHALDMNTHKWIYKEDYGDNETNSVSYWSIKGKGQPYGLYDIIPDLEKSFQQCLRYNKLKTIL